jgi:hypothetical protein
MDAGTLISCWEHGRRRHALDRGLLLFAAAEPDADPDSLADRPLGERNAALLRLRRAMFGDQLKSCVDCPECQERLEFVLSANALLARAPGAGSILDTGFVEIQGLRIRLPTTRDLVTAASETDELSAAYRLLQRLCVDGAPEPSSADFEAEMASALDDADPCMDFAIDLTCPACSHGWNANFDVPGFLWEEIDAHARRLLDEVHALARSYGWSERQILELSDVRRNAYLERVLA